MYVDAFFSSAACAMFLNYLLIAFPPEVVAFSDAKDLLPLMLELCCSGTLSLNSCAN